MNESKRRFEVQLGTGRGASVKHIEAFFAEEAVDIFAHSLHWKWDEMGETVVILCWDDNDIKTAWDVTIRERGPSIQVRR